MDTFTGSAPITVNYSNAATECTPAVSSTWSDGRPDLLEAMGHLGHLINALGALFGPGVAAPLREALDDVRGLELGLVDGVIDSEARLRDQLGDVQQHLNRTNQALADVQDRFQKYSKRLTDAVLEEVARARRQNRGLSAWAVETINDSRPAARHLIPEPHWQWLLECEKAVHAFGGEG